MAGKYMLLLQCQIAITIIGCLHIVKKKKLLCLLVPLTAYQNIYALFEAI